MEYLYTERGQSGVRVFRTYEVKGYGVWIDLDEDGNVLGVEIFDE